MYPVTLSPEAQKVWAALSNPNALRDITNTMSGYSKLVDVIFPKRWPTTNGGVFVDHDQAATKPSKGVEPIAPGASYPVKNLDEAKAIYQEMTLVGRAAEITLQRLRQNLWLDVDRAIKHVAFGIGQYRALHAFAKMAEVKAKFHQVAGSSWASIKDQKPIEEIMAACQAIEDMELGYIPNVLVLPSANSLKLSTSQAVMNLVQHYKGGRDLVTYNGATLTLPGYELTVVNAPKSAGLTDPIVLANADLGGQAYPEISPEATAAERLYAENGIRVSAKWYGREEASPAGHQNVWWIAGDDEINPYVDQPKAAAVITGTA